MNNIDSESSIYTQGGKDHASGRYVFTCLSPITRFLFPKEDDILLDYLREDGQSIEPIWQVSSVVIYPWSVSIVQTFYSIYLTIRQVLSHYSNGSCEWE